MPRENRLSSLWGRVRGICFLSQGIPGAHLTVSQQHNTGSLSRILLTGIPPLSGSRESGRRLFDELDADHDGQVRLEDLESAMRRRRLPPHYAKEFLRRTRRHWLATSFGWEEFRSLMEQKEASMLRAFNSLNINTSGTLQKSQVLASLQRAGLPATDSNARAMMRFLDADLDTERGQVAYGQFRNFLLLLPPERLERDPR